MSLFRSVYLLDETGTPYGVKNISNKIRVSSMPYLYDIAEGNVPAHNIATIVGYSASIDTTERTVWSYSATQAKYVFPTAEMGMELVSTDNTQDIGAVIKGDAVGNTVQADADGTTTSLEDDSVDFTAATAVAAGDIVILDPHGETPEWGFVTAVAANTLTVAGGFSEGGTAASRYYAVIDASAHTGAMVCHIHYLDGDFVKREELMVLNGTTVVPTVNTDMYRINKMNIVGSGSNYAPVGAISLRHLANTPVYSYITAGFNRARAAVATVKANSTFYVTQLNAGWASPNDSKVQSARFIVLASAEPDRSFPSIGIFYPYAEVIITNSQTALHFDVPLKFPAGTDIEVIGIAFTGGDGPASIVLRGWAELDS